jgi:hypothetical protein
MTIRIGDYYYGFELSRYFGWHIIRGRRGYLWIEMGFICLERFAPFPDAEWSSLMEEWDTPEEDEAWKNL